EERVRERRHPECPETTPLPASQGEGVQRPSSGETLNSTAVGSAAGSDLSIPQHGFLRFAETCHAIGAVGGKLEKVRLLADYLETLEGEPLAWVIIWFTGYPLPPSHDKPLQLGGALISDALCAVGGV